MNKQMKKYQYINNQCYNLLQEAEQDNCKHEGNNFIQKNTLKKNL